MKRYYVVYEGIVQGVGFRGRLMYLARKYKLTGYCRNLSNGDVEAEIQGNNIDAFIKESINSDGFTQVYNYSLKLINTVENEEGFIVKF